MSENAATNAPKTRTPKALGPRAYLVRNGDKRRIITADEIRVASQSDLMDALSGKIPSEGLTPAQ